MMKVRSIIIPTIYLALSAMLFSSCGFRKKNDTVKVIPQSSQPPQTEVEIPKTKEIEKPTQAPISKTLVLTVDPEKTTGTIDLSMDPKGAVLGTRKARDTRPLKGTVTVKITEYPESGKKQISIQDIQLRNTERYTMNFSWGALVGGMQTSIAKNILRIIPNDLNRVATLKDSGLFTLPKCYFTVLGDSQVKGSGLVLAKAVGNKKVTLAMKKTEPIDLKAIFTEKNGIFKLRILRAVLRDRFDFDGTQLGLVFTADITADITATAQNL